MNLVIITACSRPENLQKIKESINVKCEWIIVYDSSVPINNFDEKWITEIYIQGGIVGAKQKNIGLDYTLPYDYVYFLDDDNLLHPDFNKLLEIVDCKKYLGYIFAQDLNRSTRMPDVKVGYIDLAQYLLRRELIGDIRFSQTYECDGYLIEEIYKKYSDKILILNDIYSYYNRLAWTK
jgi:hypothetical protein